jgi:AraC-like DNA-binding protein
LTVLEKFLPSSPLSTYIENYCFYEGDAPLHTKERCLPTGSMAVVINLSHDTLRVALRERDDQFLSFHGGVLNGAFSEFCVIDPTTLVTTMSINFKPGGAGLFLPMPASELTNQVVELFTFWGRSASDLREQLQAAQTRAEMVRILECFLLAHMAWERTPHPAVTFALASFQAGNERRSISEVTAQLSLSPRRFIHLFDEAVGLTPKVFCRLLRFQEGLSLIEAGQRVSWIDLALSCGYYDQAHFIHDFQAFSGLTPQAYLEQRGPSRNHVPLLAP